MGSQSMKFVYNIRDNSGSLKTGKMVAESREEVEQQLLSRGFRILSIYGVTDPKGKKNKPSLLDSDEENDSR